MVPEQAAKVAEHYFNEISFESPTTRKVLAAVPDEKADYKPDPKARTGFELAKHIAATEIWFLDGIAKGEFDYADELKVAAEVRTPSEVTAFYDAQLGPALERVKALRPEQLAKNIQFYGFDLPAVSYLGFLLSHTIHHRGQLSVYLRPMGSKVPSIYGGSADEPFEAAAAAQ